MTEQISAPNASGTSPFHTMSPIGRLVVSASIALGLGLVITLITWANWDRGGWTDSDGEWVDAGPFPWTGIVIAGIPTFIGLALLTTAIIAKGVQLGMRPASDQQAT